MVFCKLNKSIKVNVDDEQPEYYIFPTQLIKDNISVSSTWQKFYIKQIPNLQEYYMNWDRIKNSLL